MGLWDGSMGDHIYSKKDFEWRETKPSRWFLGWWICLVIGVGALFVRAMELQIWSGEYFWAMADDQRVRLVSIPTARGIIYDRNGEPLLRNIPVFRKLVIDREKGLYFDVISREEALAMQQTDEGPRVIEAVDREYLYGKELAHVLGYLGEASQDEIDQSKVGQGNCAAKLEMGSLVGRAGVEGAYDCVLRGKDGTLLLEVDTSGGMVREFGRQAPVSGNRLDLTIDLGLQKKAYEALGGKVGGLVAIDPTTGEVLAMVSAPTFDPEWFGMTSRLGAKYQTNETLADLFNAPEKPLLNRTVASMYPPGSIFKLVVATAGLEEGTIDKNALYTDTGLIQMGSYQFRNWYFLKYGTGEGSMNVVRALARSTDTFFYDLGGKLGPEKMAKWARVLGFGSQTGVGLQSEAVGLIPDPEWKIATRNEKWYLGNSYHMSIGQGDVLVTPLQVAAMTSVFANNGVKCQPHLVKGESNCKSVGIGLENLGTVIAGMEAACSPGGTASVFFNSTYAVACKTGTAEYGPVDANGRRATHAWITVMSLDKDEENKVKPLVVSVLVEGGGEGSIVAAPIAKQVMDYWQNS